MQQFSATEITLIKRANILAIPTDTVAGLCAPLKNHNAIEKLFQLKQRPITKTMMLLLPDYLTATQLFEITPWQANIIQLNSPGQISFLLPLQASIELSPHLYSQTDEERIAGFRIPASPEAQAILKITGPLAQTSLNISGQPPITSSDEIPFQNDIDFIYPFHDLEQTPSTIVRLYEQHFQIVRQGKSSLALPE